MSERRFRGMFRVPASAGMLWVLSHSRAVAEEATTEVPSMWSQGLGSAYLFGFGGGVVMFFVLLLLKAREDKPSKGDAK